MAKCRNWSLRTAFKVLSGLSSLSLATGDPVCLCFRFWAASSISTRNLTKQCSRSLVIPILSPSSQPSMMRTRVCGIWRPSRFRWQGNGTSVIHEVRRLSSDIFRWKKYPYPTLPLLCVLFLLYGTFKRAKVASSMSTPIPFKWHFSRKDRARICIPLMLNQNTPITYLTALWLPALCLKHLSVGVKSWSN